MNSPVVSAAQMRATEAQAFARGIEVEALMDQAGAGIATAIRKFFPVPSHCVVYAGKGNNGGDALVAAAHLQQAGWRVHLRLAFPESESGKLMRKKIDSFGQHSAGEAFDGMPGRLILLDGLLGLGAKPPLREPIRSLCREINQRRREEAAFVFAVDLPTGIEGDTGELDRDCVIADCTVSIGLAKKGLVVDTATNHVGRLEIVPLPDLQPTATDSNERLATANVLRPLLPRRDFDVHKNQFGRIGVVAGSRGFTGAAVMCSLGALRAGAGLVELFVPEDVYDIVAAAAAPEVMVKPVQSYVELLENSVDVWALGPGLGKSRAIEIVQFMREARQPMVVDADGINILSQNIAVLQECAGPRLLTPHPGEMKRLFGDKDLARAEIARQFCQKHTVTLLLKGSRTIVAERGQALSYNTTGNPGMATGGMGDVLTGVAAALIAQKLTLYNAARIGAWLCGRAAELAIFHGDASEESLLPRDVLDHLGSAFNDLRGHR